MTDQSLSRRHFLAATCGILAAGFGTALLADEAQAAPGITRKKNGQVVVRVAKVPALANVGGSVNLGTVKGVPTALVRTGDSTYSALDLRCTHQGAFVTASNAGWSCPAHGSAFDANGAVTRGPATTNLRTVKSAWRPKSRTVVVG